MMWHPWSKVLLSTWQILSCGSILLKVEDTPSHTNFCCTRKEMATHGSVLKKSALYFYFSFSSSLLDSCILWLSARSSHWVWPLGFRLVCVMYAAPIDVGGEHVGAKGREEHGRC